MKLRVVVLGADFSGLELSMMKKKGAAWSAYVSRLLLLQCFLKVA